MRFPRSGGVLLHPTSFPSPFGIGDLGDAAYRFIDFLTESGQGLWQILPLGPTGYGDSPYQAFSAFAGNPLLVSPLRLVRDGYLPAEAIDDVPPFPAARVDYGPVINYKSDLLSRSFDHFRARGTRQKQSEFEQFCHQHAGWLEDFALFMALKSHHMHQDGGVWNTWPRDIAFREPSALRVWSERLADRVELVKFQQFLFFGQWLALKLYANERGVRVVGDVPIFVAFDSADVWSNPDLFFCSLMAIPSLSLACRRIILARQGNGGGTRSTAGTNWRRRITPGGQPA